LFRYITSIITSPTQCLHMRYVLPILPLGLYFFPFEWK